jgi:hypothetical protein
VTKADSSQAGDALKPEKKPIKRERSSSSVMPALKTARGANGKTVYILDSDSEEGNEVEEVAAPPRERESITLEDD